MNKYKICHMTSAHKSNDTRIFHKQCVSLAKEENFQVFLVARGDSREEKGVNIVGIGMEKVGRLSRMFSVSKAIYKKALEIDADIYQIHDPELLPYAYKLHKKGKKVIFDSHEDTYTQIKIKTYIPSFVRSLIGKIYYNYESKVTKKIDGVIFPCPINQVHPFQDRAKRYIYINNVPILKDENGKKMLIKSIERPICFCYVGSLSENRGVTNLLRAFKLSSGNNKLILAGNLSKEYKEELEKEELLQNVDYRGFCTQEEVGQIYEEAHVGISNLLNVGQYPTLGTFPTKVFEYMENYLSVIVSDYAFSRDLIEKEKFGLLIDPSKPEELAKAMDYMGENIEVLKDFGQRGYSLVKEKYNWQIESKKLLDFYKKILYN